MLEKWRRSRDEPKVGKNPSIATLLDKVDSVHMREAEYRLVLIVYRGRDTVLACHIIY